MRALFSNKIWIALLSLIALAALTVLAIGMREISFREAQPFGREESSVVRSVTLDAVTTVFSIPLPTQLMIWGLFILMFALVGMMLSPELRKRLITIAIRVAITYWGLYLLFTRYREILAQMGLNLASPAGGLSEAANGAALPVFEPPQPASWALYLLAFGIIILVIFIGWKAYSFWKEINAPPGFAKDRIAKIARASLLDLSSGKESTDVILNCYYRMGDAISHRKSIDRSASMTPSEFASRLQAAGFPFEAVQTLTRLFESVRYGGRKSEPRMVDEAVASLTSILQYCGEPA